MRSLEGYIPCVKCSRPTLEYLAYQTGRQCWECFQANPVLQRAAQVEVMNRAIATSVRVSQVNRTRRGRPKANRAAKDGYQNARREAMARLAARHPGEILILEHEERLKRDLPPKFVFEKDVVLKAIETIAKRFDYPADNLRGDWDAAFLTPAKARRRLRDRGSSAD